MLAIKKYVFIKVTWYRLNKLHCVFRNIDAYAYTHMPVRTINKKEAINFKDSEERDWENLQGRHEKGNYVILLQSQI